MKNTFTLIAGTLAFAGAATAATVQIDIGHTNALSAGSESGSGWNNFAAGVAGQPSTTTISDLVDSANNSSGIGVTYSPSGNMGGTGTGADYTGIYPAALTGMPVSATHDSFFFKAGTSATLSFTGLTNGQAYEFLAYGARGNNGGSIDFEALIGAVSQDTGSIANVYLNNTDTVTLSFVADATGTVDFTAAHGSGGDGALSLVTLTAVPEPSTAALLGLGGLALILRRRK